MSGVGFRVDFQYNRGMGTCTVRLAVGVCIGLMAVEAWGKPAVTVAPVAPDAAVKPGTAAATAETETVAAGELGERVVRYARRAEAFGFSGAVLAGKGGRVVAAVGVGSSDLAGKEPNTPATLFEVASVTKQFTAAAVLRLVQEGKLKLDDPIDTILPDVPENCGAITIRHLLAHTSGIPGSNSRGGGDDLAAVLPVFLAGGPRQKPGTRFEYWNQGYAIVSEIVARASGRSYTTYLRQSLFGPAGLKVTCFTGDKAPTVEGVAATVATGRSMFGEPRTALEHPYGSYGLQYRGMGGVVSSVQDLWRWDRALAASGDAALLTEASKAEMFRAGPGEYGLGWRIGKTADGKTVQSHGGGVRGFACQYVRLPDVDGCVVILANADDAPVNQMVSALQAMVLAPEDRPAPAAVDLPEPLGAAAAELLVGSFTDEKGNVLTVVRERKATKATITWAGRPGLRTNAFLVAGAPGREGAQGTVALFEWTAATPVEVKMGPNGKAAELAVGGQRFVRKP